MSTDFSIKPVGAPVAAPIVQPIREAARQAVKTELPANSTVTAADASLAVRHDSNVVSTRSNQVVIDREAASIVYQVIDNRTSEVVKQFPDEAVLRRRAYFRSLELAKEAPTRLRATDRKA